MKSQTLLVVPKQSQSLKTDLAKYDLFIASPGQALVGEAFDSTVLLLGVYPDKKWFEHALLCRMNKPENMITIHYFQFISMAEVKPMKRILHEIKWTRFKIWRNWYKRTIGRKNNAFDYWIMSMATVSPDKEDHYYANRAFFRAINGFDNRQKFDYIHLTCPWNRISCYTYSPEDFALLTKHLQSKETYENNN